MKEHIAVGLAVVLCAAAVLADSEPQARSITVAGEGKVEVEPDYAEIVLAVSITKTEAAEAKAEVDAVFVKLMKIFEELKIKAEDINSTRMYMAPEYRYIKDTMTFQGYEVTRKAHVTLRDIDKLEALLQRAVEAGVTHAHDVSLHHSKEEQLRKQALEKACAAAKNKAEFVATQFAAKVGPVRTIDLAEEWSGRFVALGAADPFAAGGSSPSSYRFGKIEVRADVKATFDLVVQ